VPRPVTEKKGTRFFESRFANVEREGVRRTGVTYRGTQPDFAEKQWGGGSEKPEKKKGDVGYKKTEIESSTRTGGEFGTSAASGNGMTGKTDVRKKYKR